jgi:hypothetical protein
VNYTVADFEIRKKKKHKNIACWLLVDLAITCIILALLFYKPSRYKKLGADPVNYKPGQVNSYLTYLLSELYNGAQKGQPFELIVIEDAINETISQSNLPMEAEGVTFSLPVVRFVPPSVVLMGTASIKGAEFIVTIEVEPSVDQKGLMNLLVTKIKIGAMNITPLAKIIAKKMYQNRIATESIDLDDIRTKIAGSLLNDEPFEPVFRIEDKKVRLKSVTVTLGKLILHFVPA